MPRMTAARPQAAPTEDARLLVPSEMSPRLLRLATLFVGCGVLALFVDLPVFRFCSAGRIPGDLFRVLTWSELFAHGIGVALLAGTMFVLDPAKRVWIPRVLATSLGSGLAADLVKQIFARFRPNHFAAENVWETFAGCLPSIWPITGYSTFDYRLQSFPSAHTAVATGLAIGLASVYPRGGYLFAFFAILAAGQRIASGAHFLSDTLGGAAVGCLISALVLKRFPGPWRSDK